MRALLFFILILCTSIALAQEKADSVKNSVKFSGSVAVNSNGIAPIPSFALGKPALSANLSVAKGRFSYDPLLSYDFHLKPWIIDNWLHYKIIVKPKFEFRTGVNIGSFFSDIEVNNQTIRQSQRYFALELSGTYKVTEKTSLSLTLWLDKGADPGTIEGYFINFAANRSDIRLGKHLLMDINLQAFVIDYTLNNDGFFFSPTATLKTPHVPIFLFYQGIHPITSNISPEPGFQWNLGLGYSF